MIEVRCETEADTRACARKLAASLRPGDVIVLSGGLGVGKTVFTSGLAAGLGIEELVVSPSYVLVRGYTSGFLPLIHADVYRLTSLNEFDDLDVFELASDGVLVVEWGNAIESSVPGEYLEIEMKVVEGGARVLAFKGSGSWDERDLEGLA